ncbi:hypothetical protein GCM10020367_54900 [Streptomyces sannanensis]|uniref:Isochorismatase family protein n=1 Tax=Streptomyces sannanensis TaxID=285536 RepID=A0ABP6SJC2_9ACTN
METTTRVASDLGYRVTFVTDATATNPIPHRDAPADRSIADMLADPRTLSAEEIIRRTELSPTLNVLCTIILTTPTVKRSMLSGAAFVKPYVPSARSSRSAARRGGKPDWQTRPGSALIGRTTTPSQRPSAR